MDEMKQPNKLSNYSSGRDILDRHGFIIWAMYWITYAIAHLTFSHHLRALPERPKFRFARDPRFPKPSAWWQDLASIFPMIFLTIIAVTLSWSNKPTSRTFGSLLAIWAIIDSVNYLLRVLWFDDLTPGITELKIAVSSHRRILFITFLSFIQTILLFPTFYHLMSDFSTDSYSSLLEISFQVATLLQASDPMGIPTVFQVGISVFFLAVAIAVIAAISYGRPELSGRDKGAA